MVKKIYRRQVKKLHAFMMRHLRSIMRITWLDKDLIPTPRDYEVDHMPVSGRRMHPGGLAFIPLLEHGVRYYEFELRA